MATRIVGVDIGSEAIRAVEIEGAGTTTPVVTRYREFALPEGAVESGEVVEVNTVATLLRQLWQSAGFKSKRVVLGMGNTRVLVRDLTVPRAGPRQLRDALPFQVQDLLTVPVAEALLDFYPVSEGEEDGIPVLNGLLIAANKEAVNTNVRAVRLAGLIPVGVDLIPFALVRLHAASIGKNTVAIVDVGARTTTIVVAVAGVPQFVRIVPTGGHDLTRTLAERMGVLPEQAESVKRSVGLVTDVAHPDDSAAVIAIHSFTRELLDAIRNTLRYFANSHVDLPLHHVIVSGGGAQLNGFFDALREVTGVPVVAAEPFSGMQMAKTFRQDSHDRPAAMSVALGLTLGSVA
jgi:type IV pilus assembly protein PilM